MLMLVEVRAQSSFRQTRDRKRISGYHSLKQNTRIKKMARLGSNRQIISEHFYKSRSVITIVHLESGTLRSM